MSKLLEMSHYLTYIEPTFTYLSPAWPLIVKQKQQDIEGYVAHQRIRDEHNREKVFFCCISRRRCLSKVENSDGLLIKLKSNGKNCDFKPFNQDIPLEVGEFAISKEVIIAICDTQLINSLVVYPCENDSIVIEISKDICRDDGAGGDGTKVKIPT
ncbi:hypothetical protein VB796_03760 [Arcicella sp. LKC2W]|uniref:hypothetical protein n=1 Tax=Arcicella sp. LKC2W TaxID=2984198 RepID=UPI002B20D7D2|nr:hypothetical protein [Arcicella sp. LKC2W]MEA5458134.1 hypothetical protein [Arcicella sp. LKC2W]